MSGLSRKGIRKWLAIAIGAVAVGGASGQPPAATPSPGKAVTPPAPEPAAPRSTDPLGTMLSDAKSAYAKVRDYTCTFTRQERVNGVLKAEQVAELKCRVKPTSISLRFARPESVAGMEMAFVSTSRSGKVRYRAAGAKGQNGSLRMSLDDPKLLAENRHVLTEVGIGPLLDLLDRIAHREKTLGNPVEAFSSDYLFAGKNVTRYEILTRRPHAYRYAYRCLVYVDKETKLPLRFEAYDAPKPGTLTGDLLEAYSYTDIKINVGLGDSSFD